MSKQDNLTEYPVKMWTFEQWKAGIAPPFFGMVLSWTGKPMIHEIDIEDYRQVLAEQKRCYDELVKQKTKSKINHWQKRLARSRDKEALLKAEVNRVHDMIYKPESWKQRQNMHFNTYWNEYIEVIVKGNVKPHAEYYPYHDGRAGADKGRADNRKAERYAEVEALYEYWNYLRGESAVSNRETSPAPDTQYLKDLFAESINDWHKYFDAFTQTNPPLLAKTSTGYRFMGRPRGHSGIIATFMKKLKEKLIIKPNIDRATIAKILSSSIENFSIAGSSVTNESSLYSSEFKEQLQKLTGIS